MTDLRASLTTLTDTVTERVRATDPLTFWTTASILLLTLIALVAAFLTRFSDRDETPNASRLYYALASDTSISINESGVYTPIPLGFENYVIQEGDSFWRIAEKTGVRKGTLLSANPDVKSNAHMIQAGTTLRIPNRDGLLYHIKKGDTPESVAEEYFVTTNSIIFVNASNTTPYTNALDTPFTQGTVVYLSGAEMPQTELADLLLSAFICPLLRYRISSPFGYRRDPFTGGRRYHKGIDMAAPTGTPVRASRNGTIVFAGRKGGYGKVVIIRHSGGEYDGYTTYYAHLHRYVVRVGQKVARGAVIAYVGSTGRSTGPHLHFEVRRRGTAIDPRKVRAVPYHRRR